MARDARANLIRVLRSACSGELAAIHAYRGHAGSVRSAEQRARIRVIEDEEHHHRTLVLDLLADLGSSRSRRRDALFWCIGKTIAFLCHIGGWFIPMYGAGKLERSNIVEYEDAARYARACGREEMIDCLLTMAEVEWEHERFFREIISGHWMLKVFRGWNPPPPKEMIRGMNELFARAVALIGTGDIASLATLLDEHPELVRERTDFEGHAYFHRPYLLWFVAENPVRNGTLPPNIAEIAKLLIDRGADQLDYALELVCSGRVPRETGVQRALIDVLCDAGASPDSAMRAALAHQEMDAVQHLLDRGARVTLLAAACLGYDLTPLLNAVTNAEELQTALTAAAFFGNAKGIQQLIAAGADVNAFSPEGFHAHATPLHQAVYANCLDCVRILVEAGARRDVRDRVHDGTPLRWAEYLKHPEIATYLHELDR
ncbi:MAG TPA: ankyrin repeat domain-containing protein [Thermoanaerobaculia bacterium]|nr:ankyrin repeat domain-containing protein [Thermoanaerobaculia bacterium]